jgi:beta-aspartyl-peptidase (threonine type)
VQHVKNPIDLARAVMEKTPHVILAGEGAEEFALNQGFTLVPNSYFQTDRRRKQWERLREKNETNSLTAKYSPDSDEALGTVGCVALDQSGNLAAATSTGGLPWKLPGRVGDTPIPGAGTYANNATCAVSGTGKGEYFIRTSFGHTVSDLMAYKGLSVQDAADETIKQLEAIGGEGGCIAIDKEGNITMPFDTSGMYRGYKLSDGRFDIKLYGKDE